jgi:flagellar basal-body rod modification protein FlgD
MNVSGIGNSLSTQEIASLFTTTSTSALGKDDFLKLLVTQLSNQDPLDPQSNEEFVAQLAQFSSLEQMQNINSTLETNSILTQSVNNALSAGLIGKEVRAVGDSLEVGETGSMTVPINLAANADVTITIKNSAGETVRILTAEDLKSGTNEVAWDGLNTSGERVDPGTYTYAVSAVGADGAAVTANTYITGVVTGVKFVNGNAVLLIGDREVSLSAVVQITQPAATG